MSAVHHFVPREGGIAMANRDSGIGNDVDVPARDLRAHPAPTSPATLDIKPPRRVFPLVAPKKKKPASPTPSPPATSLATPIITTAPIPPCASSRETSPAPDRAPPPIPSKKPPQSPPRHAPNQDHQETHHASTPGGPIGAPRPCCDSQRTSPVHGNAGLPDGAEPDSAPTSHDDHTPATDTTHASPPSDVKASTDPDNLASGSPSSLANPPSIRVISAELELESQMVRSLYESGDPLAQEYARALGPPIAFSPSKPTAPSQRSHHTPSHPATTSPSARGAHAPHERAGGIEDWEGISGEDVDRYGFIAVHRPDSRPTSSSESKSVHSNSPRQRKIRIWKDPSLQSLMVSGGRTPSKKLSARSLSSQASDMSTASRRSTRSAIRQATNLLPHNRDRKLVDEAGDHLAAHPALSNIVEDEAAERQANELKLKEAKRTEKWRRMGQVTKPGLDSQGEGMTFEFDLKHPKLAKRVWKGIPDCWRSAAWYSFLYSSAKASSEPFVTDEQIKADFHELQNKSSPDDNQIDMDVPRTINQHIMFRTRYRGGQRLLFRVLHALSLYFPETGYGQGMAPLAATLLSYYEEETCFVMLVRLWKFRGLNRLYGCEFKELLETLDDFQKYWLEGREVATKLSDLIIDPTAYATRWYLTLFNLSIPFPAQLRIWDAFMLLGASPPAAPASGESPGGPSSQGLEILHATSLAIIDCHRENLLGSDFENAMHSLTSFVPIRDVEGFVGVVHAEWKQHQSKHKKI